MAKRAGWRQYCLATGKALTPFVLQSSLCDVILAKLKEAGAAHADWTLNDAAFRLCGVELGANGPMSI